MRLLMQVGDTVLSIGSSYNGTPGAGLVSFRANDDCAGDNSGTYNGSITVTSDPCPGTLATPDVKVVAPEGGPGTELKKLLGGWPFYITATPTCPCNARAAEMDRREREEPGWCAKNEELILGWLKEQADARGLPFVKLAAKALLRRAISNAKKKQPPAPGPADNKQ